MKILLVDDERLILLGLKNYIEKIQDIECKVETADNAKQALWILEDLKVDLLITDIEMPGMSGLEFLEKVVQRNLCPHTIVLSGYDKFEYARGAIRFGVRDYLLKPVDKEELKRHICEVAHQLELTDELDRMEPYRQYFPHMSGEEIPYPLKKSVKFIEENYRGDISLTMLAEACGKSENYLCKLFKKEWNTTFLEIVNEIRLKEAVYLLLYHPELSVKDVAGKVGYKTERQIFRLIKAKTGMTPQQIREKSG